MQNKFKKINYRLLLCIFSLVLLETICYFLVKTTFFEIVLLNTSLDKKIPFIKGFIYFYISWYLLLIFIPYYLYNLKKSLFYNYVASMIISIFISSLIFFIFPTIIVRPSDLSNDFTSLIVKLVYYFDTPNLNCFPSMHCVVCFLFIYYISHLKNVKWDKRFLLIAVLLMIVLSTLFVKQHVLFDVIGALIVTILSLIITKLFGLQERIKKLLIKYYL